MDWYVNVSDDENAATLSGGSRSVVRQWFCW